MRSLICLLVIGVLFTSCQKELSFDIGGTTATSGTCNTYFPLSNGDTWTYDMGGGVTQVNTVTSPDTVIGGNTFKRFTQTIGGATTPGFAREDASGNLYMYMDLGVAGVASGQVLINPHCANANVGDKWKDSTVINGVGEKFEYTLLEKNINYQVDTFHFTNVNHVQYTTTLDFPPVFNNELVGIADVWLAKCIGGVESKSTTILMGVPVGTTDQKIKSYTIH